MQPVLTRFVAALRPLFLAAAELGIDVDGLLGRFDVDPSILDDGLARIDAALSNDIALALAEECGEAPLAILAARHVHVGALGLFDHIVSSALTMREAAALGAQFFGLLDDTADLVLTEDGRQGSLMLVPRDGPPIAPLLAEFALVTIMQIVWNLLGHNNPCTEVRFAHVCPSDPRAYEDYFKSPVRFGAERSEMVFPRAFLEAHVRNGDPSARDALTQRATELIARRPAEGTAPGFVERARSSAAVALADGDGSLSALAARLGTSCRTLQRRLKQHGTSFAEILDEARRELATSHVASGGMSVASIAERLGFADPSTFARAFRRWTAMSPTDYRAARG